jgi:signal transduction histidine kinase/ligand-binding sensor domain-containing protein
VRHPVGLLATLSSIVVAWCICACALDPALDVNQYGRTVWKIRDGFAKGEIVSIAQTLDGYLWLGTEFGVYRFDGVRAVPWQPPGSQRLPTGRIPSLLVSRDGTVWIGSSKGLASWKDGKLTQYPELEGEYVYALLEDRDGTVWAAAGGAPLAGRLCAFRGASADCVGGDGRFGSNTSALHEDSRGNLWVGVKDGLWRWKPGPPEFYRLAGELDGIKALAEDSDGTLLVGYKSGIYRFLDGEKQPYLLGHALPQYRAYKMLRDQNGGIWLGTTGSGIIHAHQGKTDVFRSDDLTDDVLSLFEDHEGNIWVSTSQGLIRFRDFSVATLTTKQGLSRDLVGAVLPDTDGSLWFATYSGLNRWSHGQITTPETGSARRDGKINGSVPNSLVQDKEGRVWISTPRELGYLKNGQFTDIKDAPVGNILSMTQDSASNLWAINEKIGLVRISPQNDVQQIPWSSLGHRDNASVLFADRTKGGLWIGFFKGGISYLSNGQVRVSYTTADGLAAGRVSDFLFGDDGTLWISTEGGLSRLKNNHLATLTSKNGLPCDTVHWAIEDDDRSMWLYTACGLVRIARSEVDAWSTGADKHEGTARKIHFTVFDDSDGVRSLATPGHNHPQVAKTPDGKLWFLPWDGVSVIDPHHLPFNKLPPPVHIEQITADGKSYDPANGLQLPPHVRNLAIDYTALSLVAPEKVRFRYKLEGQDPDWREVVNDRQVQYSNLGPRHYTFRVLACNNSGVWNETGASLEFSVLPAFYQTNWFRALCALGLLALLWGVYRLRVQQLQRQFNIALDARVNERTRIARELHDTLLQNFQASLVTMQAARNLLLQQPEKAAQTLDDAIDSTAGAIDESRDAIQGLRSVPMASGNLGELLTTTSEHLAKSGNAPPVFELIEEGERRTLSPATKDEICRIALEILRNAYRHANARSIEAEVRYGEHGLRMRIRDDGSGMDPKVLEEGGVAGHYGLRGMRERAQRMGARLDLWTEAGAGTEIQLTVPASVAYENSRGSTRIAS